MAESKVKNGDASADDQTTIVSNGINVDRDEKTQAIEKDEEKTTDKTIAVFKIDDITKKLQDEIEEIPEVEAEDMDSGQLSGIIKNIFPERSEAERLTINRHFLRDAEPFRIERLLEDIKNRPQGLVSGFTALDQAIFIPNSALTVVTSEPRHGKSIFMLNMLSNMANIYKDKHFLYYTYEEVKRDIEIKLINMSGDIPFSGTGDFKTNLACWKHILREKKTDELLNMSESNPEYAGLKRFMEISQRIHIIDYHYNIINLVDSIKSFNNTFSVGAVFIDFFQKIKTDRRKDNLPRQQQLRDISENLREAADNMKLPLLFGAQFSAFEKGKPEYDILSAENIKEIVELEWAANLVIGLQDYSRSKYIGSNITDNFKSKLFDHKLIKAEKIQGNFSKSDLKSIILVKVLLNREGLEPEEELLFHRSLLKIKDLNDDDIQLLKKNLR